MKKILSVILIATLSMMLVACFGGNNKDEQQSKTQKEVLTEENVSGEEDNIEETSKSQFESNQFKNENNNNETNQVTTTNSYTINGITISAKNFSIEPYNDSNGQYTKKIVVEFTIKNESELAFGYITSWNAKLNDGYKLQGWTDIMDMNLKQVSSGAEKTDTAYFLIDDSINPDEIIVSYDFMNYGEEYWNDLGKIMRGEMSEKEYTNKYGNFKVLEFDVVIIEDERNAKEMLEEILSWYVGDIWNNFVDFDSFRTTGKDCTGSEIDIEFAYKNFKKEYEAKDKYNAFINSLPNDYSELKETWSKMNEQIEKIYNDLEGNGVNEGGENLELDLLSQYDDSFAEIINELE